MLPIVAIATGDPAGIGPEISLKAALDPRVRALCQPLLVGDPDVLARQAKSCGIDAHIHVIETVGETNGDAGVPLLAVPVLVVRPRSCSPEPSVRVPPERL